MRLVPNSKISLLQIYVDFHGKKITLCVATSSQNFTNLNVKNLEASFKAITKV